DVAGSLPPALARRGVECAVVLPLYHAARTSGRPIERTPHVFRVPVGDRMVEGRLWRSSLADGGVPVFLVEQNDYYDRDDPAAAPRPLPAAPPLGAPPPPARTPPPFRLSLPGRPGGAPPARLLARRPPRQRLPDRPRPRLPARGLPPLHRPPVRALRARQDA